MMKKTSSTLFLSAECMCNEHTRYNFRSNAVVIVLPHLCTTYPDNVHGRRALHLRNSSKTMSL